MCVLTEKLLLKIWPPVSSFVVFLATWTSLEAMVSAGMHWETHSWGFSESLE